MSDAVQCRFTEFELKKLDSDAKHKTVCQRCFGTGQLHYSKPIDSWELCPVCKGEGRAPGEPHVIELVAEVRSLLSLANELSHQRKLDQEHRELLIAEYEERIQKLQQTRRRESE